MARRCDLDPLTLGGWRALPCLPLLGDSLEESLDTVSMEWLLPAPPLGLSTTDDLCPFLELMKPTFKAKPIVWTVERFCLTCGLSSSEWPNGGVSTNDKMYCCQGCAHETGCVCRVTPLQKADK
jgi:hypothetical protein